MKSLLPALALAAVSMTVIGVALLATRGGEAPPVRWRDAGRMAPASLPALAGSRDGVEVLVKRRFALEERDRFTRARFANQLGLPPGRYRFLEVFVRNDSGRPVRVDPDEMILRASDGSVRAVRDLRELTSRERRPVTRALLAAHAPDPGEPLGTEHLRRLLVAVPADVDVGGLASGRVAGVDLEPRRITSAALDTYLDEPRGSMLEALAEPPAPSSGGAGSADTEEER